MAEWLMSSGAIIQSNYFGLLCVERESWDLRWSAVRPLGFIRLGDPRKSEKY